MQKVTDFCNRRLQVTEFLQPDKLKWQLSSWRARPAGAYDFCNRRLKVTDFLQQIKPLLVRKKKKTKVTDFL